MPHIAVAALAANRPSAIIGAPRNEGDPVQRVLNQVSDELSRITGEMRNRVSETQRRLQELETRNRDIEQQLADGLRLGGRGGGVQSWGQQFVADPQFAAIGGSNGRGVARVTVKSMTSAIGSGGALIAPDRRSDAIMKARRRVRIRDLVAPGQTSSNSIEYPRQTTRTNNAAVVSEGGQKPESNIAFDLATWPVRTIAHWIPASKQLMDDSSAIASLIDSELRYGLDLVEEAELLSGSGVGQHLTGLITGATAFSPPFVLTGVQMLDMLLQAIAQCEEADYEPDGIVLNPLDWRMLQAIKDGVDRYIGGGPYSDQVARLWQLPIATTKAMSRDKFLVGAFEQGAQIFDRQEATVEVSTEDRDNFIKNMLTIRAEQRLAFVVKHPDAFIYGDFGNV
ncbi:phage major capsid protein [Bradyrhizobium sp. UNPA324]|uniref:phage major capsid protein n=1 Tax=Bradyrhizobium sp. UNPA324 TaxID=1141174 RepID=UPI0015EEF817|nr:phage major capsid protein [Bradyrhizobium sp. UNPA324]